MNYPTTGNEVYVSLNLSNTMLTGIGKGTITRENVSVDYLKKLFAEYGVIVSVKPEQRAILERMNRSSSSSCPSSTAVWSSSTCRVCAARTALC